MDFAANGTLRLARADAERLRRELADFEARTRTRGGNGDRAERDAALLAFIQEGESIVQRQGQGASQARAGAGAGASVRDELVESVRETARAKKAAQRAAAGAGAGLGEDGDGDGDAPPEDDKRLDFGPVVDRVALVLGDSGSEALVKGLENMFGDNLARLVNNTVVRVGSRRLTKALTVSLTDSLTHLILLAVSKPLLRQTTKMLTHVLTPALVYPLTSIISHALTHNPREDYYCWYCEHSKLYCTYCRRGLEYVANVDHYAQYYARHFTHYYTQFYLFDADVDAFFDILDTDFQRVQQHKPPI